MLQIEFYPRTNEAYLICFNDSGQIAFKIQINKTIHDMLITKYIIPRHIIR